MMRFLKKAQHETIKALIGLTLVTILVFVIFSFTKGLLASLSPEESATVRDFEYLSQEINALLQDPENFAYSKLPVTLANKYYIVGFDIGYTAGDISQVVLTSKGIFGDKKIDDMTIYRPSTCIGQACICLYSDFPSSEEDDKDENVEMCIPFAHANHGDVYLASLEYSTNFQEPTGLEFNAGSYKHDIFTDIDQSTLNDLPAEFRHSSYAYVFFCGSKTEIDPAPIIHPTATHGRRDTKPWKVQNLYIEKVVVKDKNGDPKTYIFMLPEGGQATEAIDKRIDELEKYHKQGVQETRDRILDLSQSLNTEEDHMELYELCEEFYDEQGYAEGCQAVQECVINPQTCEVTRLPCVIDEEERSLCWDEGSAVKNYYSPQGCISATEYNQLYGSCTY